MTSLDISPDHPEPALADERILPRSARVATQRALSNIYSLWCLCEKTACRRAGRCTGEPRDCLDAITPLLADTVIEGGVHTLEGKMEGLSFDELYARHPDEILALSAWNTLIEGPADVAEQPPST
jgi:hypothetical protein